MWDLEFEIFHATPNLLTDVVLTNVGAIDLLHALPKDSLLIDFVIYRTAVFDNLSFSIM